MGGATSASGGVLGSGGSVSAELDACTSDDDCSQCNWGTAPANASQCTGTYCCGGVITAKKRCEANQAAWASNCPGQSPQAISCPCVLLCLGQVVACVGNRCSLSCPPNGSPGSGGAAGTSFIADSATGGRGTGGWAGSGGSATSAGGSLGTGGDPFHCYLPDGSCAPDCYNLDPCFGDCSPNCVPRRIRYCGDGIVSGAEECDDGSNDGSYGSCNPDCTLAPRCGDGVVQPDYGEDCEPETSDDPDCVLCRRMVVCGDGVIQPPEECDDGALLNTGEYGGCAPNCIFAPHCGDGIRNGPEECDDGILDGSYGGCTKDCKLGPHCGDGIVNGPEQCDHGSDNGKDGMCGGRCCQACFEPG